MGGGLAVCEQTAKPGQFDTVFFAGRVDFG